MAEQRVALVTAGGSGMGAAAARRLAADGFQVGILSSSGKGEALATELGGLGVTGSNKSNDDLKRLVDGAISRWGRIDVLVNSAENIVEYQHVGPRIHCSRNSHSRFLASTQRNSSLTHLGLVT